MITRDVCSTLWPPGVGTGCREVARGESAHTCRIETRQDISRGSGDQRLAVSSFGPGPWRYSDVHGLMVGREFDHRLDTHQIHDNS